MANITYIDHNKTLYDQDFYREHLKFVRTDELADRGENQRK